MTLSCVCVLGMGVFWVRVGGALTSLWHRRVTTSALVRSRNWFGLLSCVLIDKTHKYKTDLSLFQEEFFIFGGFCVFGFLVCVFSRCRECFLPAEMEQQRAGEAEPSSQSASMATGHGREFGWGGGGGKGGGRGGGGMQAARGFAGEVGAVICGSCCWTLKHEEGKCCFFSFFCSG